MSTQMITASHLKIKMLYLLSELTITTHHHSLNRQLSWQEWLCRLCRSLQTLK